MKTIAFVTICFLLSLMAYGQSDPILYGILIAENTNEPVVGAVVSITGVDSDETGNDGLFTLNLRGYYQPGRQLRIFVRHHDYGSRYEDYTIRDGLPSLTIELSKDNQITIAGVVRETGTKELLGGILVQPISTYFNAGYQSPQDTTDYSGQFLFYLDHRDFTQQINFIDLTFTDLLGLHSDLRNTFDIASVIDVEMEVITDQKFVRSFNLDSAYATFIDVKQGDIVSIEARGNMSFGPLVGSAGPNGNGNLFYNIDNIVESMNHGAVLVRFDNRGAWEFCGENYQFEASTDGRINLQFEINDIRKANNSGAFQIRIIIE